MNVLAWTVVLLVGAMLAWVLVEAFMAVRKRRRDDAIQRWKDEGYDLGFRVGADLDDKARRIGERARRVGR